MIFVCKHAFIRKIHSTFERVRGRLMRDFTKTFAVGFVGAGLMFALPGGAIAQQASEGPSLFIGDESGTSTAVNADELLERAQASGEIDIILGLDVPLRP